jgi:hypothetical protein
MWQIMYCYGSGFPVATVRGATKEQNARAVMLTETGVERFMRAYEKVA